MGAPYGDELCYGACGEPDPVGRRERGVEGRGARREGVERVSEGEEAQDNGVEDECE